MNQSPGCSDWSSGYVSFETQLVSRLPFTARLCGAHQSECHFTFDCRDLHGPLSHRISTSETQKQLPNFVVPAQSSSQPLPQNAETHSFGHSAAPVEGAAPRTMAAPCGAIIAWVLATTGLTSLFTYYSLTSNLPIKSSPPMSTHIGTLVATKTVQPVLNTIVPTVSSFEYLKRKCNY